MDVPSIKNTDAASRVKPARHAAKRPTLSDIAKCANVSITAVSLILKGNHKRSEFSEELVTRVKAIAAELDYAPNLLVKSMQQGYSRILTFYNTYRRRSHNDDYMDRVLTALEMAGNRHGYDILISCIFGGSPEDTYRRLNGGYSDGVILYCPGRDEPLLEYFRNSRLPVVVVNRTHQQGVLPYVKEDYADGMRQVAGRLCDLGHRRIAALSTVEGGNPDADERIGMLKYHLAERGITIPDRRILRVRDNGAPETVPTAEEALRTLMSEPEPSTALFCWHDVLGYQILDQCERQGIDVPGQLSVIGYDGLQWPMQTRQTLASVVVDLDLIADAVVSLLHDLVKGNAAAPVSRITPVTFREGTTLAPAPDDFAGRQGI